VQRLAQILFFAIMLASGLIGLAMTTCGGSAVVAGLSGLGTLYLSALGLVFCGVGVLLMTGAWNWIRRALARDK